MEEKFIVLNRCIHTLILAFFNAKTYNDFKCIEQTAHVLNITIRNLEEKINDTYRETFEQIRDRAEQLEIAAYYSAEVLFDKSDEQMKLIF